ncbi:ribosome-binding factor A [Streptococcus gallolyticus]|nr:ribosome-binding factor A [Streptococcus gallolyticus]MCY7185055.1 ribosome-binding factor A [Streptococcus gallolyticus subsp. gallolyticus]MCY7189870.1 ribosome-binding factor A [Streptococcus gallolyticus subsp. gallolyticus]
MKKLLKSLFIYEDDPRSMVYRLTSLQANGYLEDISLLFLEEIESGERL